MKAYAYLSLLSVTASSLLCAVGGLEYVRCQTGEGNTAEILRVERQNEAYVFELQSLSKPATFMSSAVNKKEEPKVYKIEAKIPVLSHAYTSPCRVGEKRPDLFNCSLGGIREKVFAVDVSDPANRVEVGLLSIRLQSARLAQKRYDAQKEELVEEDKISIELGGQSGSPQFHSLAGRMDFPYASCRFTPPDEAN